MIDIYIDIYYSSIYVWTSAVGILTVKQKTSLYDQQANSSFTNVYLPNSSDTYHSLFAGL